MNSKNAFRLTGQAFHTGSSHKFLSRNCKPGSLVLLATRTPVQTPLTPAELTRHRSTAMPAFCCSSNHSKMAARSALLVLISVPSLRVYTLLKSLVSYACVRSSPVRSVATSFDCTTFNCLTDLLATRNNTTSARQRTSRWPW